MILYKFMILALEKFNNYIFYKANVDNSQWKTVKSTLYTFLTNFLISYLAK